MPAGSGDASMPGMTTTCACDLVGNARLALDTLAGEPVQGIPSWLLNPMEWRMIDRLAGLPEGSYARDPEPTYLRMQQAIGTCLLDQWIPKNPLSMGERGYEQRTDTATTGGGPATVDGRLIDSPEAVVAHLEEVVFPDLIAQTEAFDAAAEDALVTRIIAQERSVQTRLGTGMLKGGYAYAPMPGWDYGRYGYEPYFMAVACYPEVIGRHFQLQADLYEKRNRAAARAVVEGDLPRFYRPDHDLTDDRGTIAKLRFMEERWFPQVERCLRPLVDAGVTLVWHCDGNITPMVPGLIALGIKGFQGFQYECGVDYAALCRRKTRDGDDLTIIAGVSVTRTLPFGTPEDVRKELRFLVENGPRSRLFLGASSSIAPGVPWENLQAFVEGLQYYRLHGRG